MRKIICKVLEFVFPAMCEKVIRMRLDRANAMNAMLRVSSELREKGCRSDEIDNELYGALRAYENGLYKISQCRANVVRV